MNTPHDPRPKPRKRPRRRGGAPKGNQNARKHGRYSELRPADRAVFMRKTLRSHGLKGPFAPGALSIEDLLDDPNTNVPPPLPPSPETPSGSSTSKTA